MFAATFAIAETNTPSSPKTFVMFSANCIKLVSIKLIEVATFAAAASSLAIFISPSPLSLDIPSFIRPSILPVSTSKESSIAPKAENAVR